MIELFIANALTMGKTWLWYFFSYSQPVSVRLNIRSLSSSVFAAKNYNIITAMALL